MTMSASLFDLWLLQYFARSPELTTLLTTDFRYQDVIGRAEKPSFSDLETVNRLYKCAAGCPHSLHCGDVCYMDHTCVCQCPAGLDKAFYNGPGPYRNNLLDATCDFFASRGECLGNIKDTVRPLCAKSCGLYRFKYNTAPTETWSAVVNSNGPQPSKPGSPQWDNGGFGGRGVGVDTGNGNYYGNDFNNMNDVQYRQGASSRLPSVAIQQSIQLRQQPYMQDQQFLPQQEVRSGGVAELNLRPTILQRQTALSSSEPSMFRALVLSRGPNGKTARLLIPSTPSTGLSTGRDGGARTVYRQRQEGPRGPSSFLDSILTPVRSSGSVNRNRPFSGISNWLTVSQQQQRQRQHQQQQQQYQRARQGRYEFGSPRVGIPSRGGSRWQVDNGGFVGRNPEGNFQNSLSADYMGGVQPSGMMGPNMPVTIEVDRVNGPPPLADFSGPEFGPPLTASGGSAPADVIKTPDSPAKNLQSTGPSFMKSGLIPESFLLKEQSPPLGSPAEPGANTDLWTPNSAPAPPLDQPVPPPQDGGNPQMSTHGFDPSFSHSQAPEQQQPMGIWEALNSQGTASVSNNEPFRKTMAYSARPNEQSAFSDTRGPSAFPLSHHGDPFPPAAQQQRLRLHRQQQQQQQPPPLSLFQRLNRHQSLSDPAAAGSVTVNQGTHNSAVAKDSASGSRPANTFSFSSLSGPGFLNTDNSGASVPPGPPSSSISSNPASDTALRDSSSPPNSFSFFRNSLASPSTFSFGRGYLQWNANPLPFQSLFERFQQQSNGSHAPGLAHRRQHSGHGHSAGPSISSSLAGQGEPGGLTDSTGQQLAQRSLTTDGGHSFRFPGGQHRGDHPPVDNGQLRLHQDSGTLGAFDGGNDRHSPEIASLSQRLFR